MSSPPAPTSGSEHRSSAAPVVPLFAPGETPASPLRVALVGTFAPRQCGIATFTADTRDRLAEFFPAITADIHALDDPAAPLAYEAGIRPLAADRPEAYLAAARAINEAATDVVWVQHEFGIFGGPDGAMIRELVDAVAAPLVFTFHTVLAEPSPGQRAVMQHLISRASRIMVMSRHGRELLVSIYNAPLEIIEVIEHGAPDRPCGPDAEAKARLGLAGRKVLTTFGLIGPGKGLEHVIEALPAVLSAHPEAVYRIVGATHPVLLAREGEAYREGLIARAKALGVAAHIVWENRFLETDELLDQLAACDIYLTPYPNLEQATSGTLAYAVALGKAVVSTPYVHARELLADGVGVLIEPCQPAAIAEAVIHLLAAPETLAATQRRAWGRGRRTIWPNYARAAASLLRRAAVPAREHNARVPSPDVVPGLTGVWTMSDATGMFQHALGIVADRRHGYCLDDNARALMLMNAAKGLNAVERQSRSATYASFIHFAWNPDERRFRNFMRFDRTWCEDAGSEDSNGRALWALGHTVEHAGDPDIVEWAQGLFDEVLKHLAPLGSPRALAFAALGALAVLRAGHKAPDAHRASQTDAAIALVRESGDLLARLLEASRRPDWAWFEAVLGYDNPRLSQALIEAGHHLGEPQWIATGIETLEWISAEQTAPAGHFRAVGSESFGIEHDWRPFDQQPLEAQAAVDAAHSAFLATGESRWLEVATRAWAWYFGVNDRGVVLADIASGRCRDGLTPRGVNRNCGAESILAFQLAHYSLAALTSAVRHRPPPGSPCAQPDDEQPDEACRAAQPVAHP